MKRVLSAGAGLAAFAVLAATPAYAVDGNLPGGTSISVTIDSPADGAVLPPGPVTVTGTASIGEGQPVANTELIYVLDVSGSTDQAGGSCGRILDCEIAAANALNQEALSPGIAGTIGDVGTAVFADSAATADVTPGGGDDLITGPGTDANGNGTPDIQEVHSSAFTNGSLGGVDEFTRKEVGQFTNFAGGIAAAAGIADASNMSNKIVVFVSDGFANRGGSVNVPLADPRLDGVTFFTFAVGPPSLSSCDNPGENNEGTLRHIAESTGGTCTQVENPANLPDILPGLISSELSSLELRINGGNLIPITNVTPVLPENGPASVTYSVTTGALTAGTYELCVTARGSDGGGAGSVTDCVTVIINAPPTVDAGGPYAGQEGTAVGIAGSVVDPDGPNLTSLWTIAPQSGVDPGATCSFANPAAVSTTVTCTDDGVYTLTLTGSDGLNPPVPATTTLTLTNVAPAVQISAPANGTLFAAGTPVNFTAPFTDIGTNDTHTCTVDFDDSTPIGNGAVVEVPGSGSCTITHAFTELGPHNVLVTITDDDGDSATAVVTVVIFLPGEAFAIQASGLVTVPKTPHATCPPDETLTQASLTTPVGTVNALNASCTVHPTTGRTTAAASVNRASLLGGAITITNIESSCVADASGITRSSRVGTINGIPIGIGSGSIGIPGVAQVFYNETATVGGKLVQNAIRVRTLLGQEIILASCRLG